MRQSCCFLALFLVVVSPALGQNPSQEDKANGKVEIRLPEMVLEGVPFDAWIVAAGVPPGDSVAYTGPSLLDRRAAGSTPRQDELSEARSTLPGWRK